MKKYRKLIVAVVGVGLLSSQEFLGFDAGLLIEMIVSAGTLVGVYQVRNDSN